MVTRKRQKEKFKKVVSEQFPITPKRGGGILKIEAWENKKGEIVKYSMAYINHLIYSGDVTAHRVPHISAISPAYV